MPLLISAPGFAAVAGRQCDAPVELADLYPTLADLTGLASRAPTNLVGRSLRPLLQNPVTENGRGFAYSIVGNGGRSLRAPNWRYNRWIDGSEELYDLANDPRQFTNLASSPSHEAQLAAMRLALIEKVASLGPLPGKPR